MKLVYTAHSKQNFYFTNHISKYVLEQGCVPLNPFKLFDYFMLDTVSRQLIRNANNKVVEKCDELWVFGQISDGVLREIGLAKQFKKPIKYYEIIDSKTFKQIGEEQARLENVLDSQDNSNKVP